MTEAEAKQKWCPFAHILSTAGSYNRVVMSDAVAQAANCCGSSCAVWKAIDADNGYCGLTRQQP